jgi:hypothetical protein
LKEWLSNGSHPYPRDPDAPLFWGTGKENRGKRLAPHTIQVTYNTLYKKVKFPNFWRIHQCRIKINKRQGI